MIAADSAFQLKNSPRESSGSPHRCLPEYIEIRRVQGWAMVPPPHEARRVRAAKRRCWRPHAERGNELVMPMANRLDKTAADYIAIAVGPALIMAMVGSLVFFLLEVF